MILPLSMVVYLGLPGMMGNYVHLFLMYPVYRIEISQLPADEPRFMVWDWGPGYREDYGVVYDESDQIASDDPSGSWKERADRLGVHYGGEAPVFRHFYFVGTLVRIAPSALANPACVCGMNQHASRGTGAGLEGSDAARIPVPDRHAKNSHPA